MTPVAAGGPSVVVPVGLDDCGRDVALMMEFDERVEITAALSRASRRARMNQRSVTPPRGVSLPAGG